MLVRVAISRAVGRRITRQLLAPMPRAMSTTVAAAEEGLVLEHHHIHDPKLKEVYRPPASTVKTAVLDSTYAYEQLHRQVRRKRRGRCTQCFDCSCMSCRVFCHRRHSGTLSQLLSNGNKRCVSMCFFFENACVIIVSSFSLQWHTTVSHDFNVPTISWFKGGKLNVGACFTRRVLCRPG
jgi:hypothetical protein